MNGAGAPVIEYLAIVGIVFVVNLIPAFAPPTWSVLVLLRLETNVPGWSLVVLGALSAAAGRFVLAVCTRGLRSHFSAERLVQLNAGRELLTSGRTRGRALLALFAVAPLSSAQLFEAAGLLDLPLVRFTIAFFAGRLVEYTLAVTFATLATRSYGALVRATLLSPLGVALQLLMIGLLVAIGRIDWVRVAQAAERRRAKGAR